MRLPNAIHARVDRKKITEYLLCEYHPDGWGKAKFFRAFGFTVTDWQILAKAFQKHARTHSVSDRVESSFGIRYTVSGSLEAADGRRPMVVTVWIVETGSSVPRLVTAYPLSGS